MIDHRLAARRGRGRAAPRAARPRRPARPDRRLRDRGRGVRPHPGGTRPQLGDGGAGLIAETATLLRMRLIGADPWVLSLEPTADSRRSFMPTNTNARAASARAKSGPRGPRAGRSDGRAGCRHERYGLGPAVVRRQPEHPDGAGLVHEQPDDRRYDLHGRARRDGRRLRHGQLHARRAPLGRHPDPGAAHRGISSSPDTSTRRQA